MDQEQKTDHGIHRIIGIHGIDIEEDTGQEVTANNIPKSSLLYRDETFAIRGAIFEVYRTMGCGFLEAVYQECLMREFDKCHIPYLSQRELPLSYKGERLAQTYRADFICYEKIIIEIKAIKELGDEHRAQVINYLRATGYRLGLLVNFGHYPRVIVERFVTSQY